MLSIGKHKLVTFVYTVFVCTLCVGAGLAGAVLGGVLARWAYVARLAGIN